ncbi:MAG: tetratricopeptide repeat protein [Bacteroidia bacterium]|nr:tetratricopeptide repeat protein [Bacteroidia bacterium]
MKRFLFCFFSFLFFLTAPAQSKKHVDSLAERLKVITKRDTDRAGTLNRLAIILYNANESKKAFELSAEAKKISDSLDFKKGKIGYLSFFGQHYSQHGDYASALDNDLEALKICMEVGDNIHAINLMRNIGAAYQSTHQFDKALEFYNKALLLARNLNRKTDEAGILSNIGIIYHSKKNYEEALKYYNEALKVSEDSKNKRTKSFVLNSIGRMYHDMAKENGDDAGYDKAISYYNQSLSLKKEMNQKKGMANSLGNIGEVYNDRKDYVNALKYFNEGLQIAIETDYKDWLREGYGGLANIYESMGDYKNAFIYHKKFIDISDSLENAASKERMAQMQGLYDTGQKDKEIELLHKEKELTEIKDNRKNMMLLSAGIALLLVMIMLFFILRGYRQKKRANGIISLQKSEVEAQKKIVEHKNNEMLDSIRYAKHIQEAILPTGKATNILGEHFILYKPKDIVSGDFYWIYEMEAKHPGENGKVIVAAIDCTGHGVPGAFVSFVGHSSLVRCVNEFGLNDPGKILDKLNELVNETLRQRMSDSKVRDGMDVSMIVIDKPTPQNTNRKLFFAGANNPYYLIRNGALTETKGDKQPVGTFLEEQSKPFHCHELELKKGDEIFIFTDGLADQFGGPQQKKFKYKQFKEVLLANSGLPMLDQKNHLNHTFENWKGSLEQIDDVCVIGVRID